MDANLVLCAIDENETKSDVSSLLEDYTDWDAAPDGVQSHGGPKATLTGDQHRRLPCLLPTVWLF